jgi:hypothetical protein
MEPLPYYPSEDRIVYEVFGEVTAATKKIWRDAATILERNGLPKRDPLMCNRRLWPAVKEWLDQYNSLSPEPWT